MIKKLTIITQSYNQREFTINCVKSFKQFCPDDLTLTTIVVENSSNESYKRDVIEAGLNVKWIQNPTLKRGADANAEGIVVGLKNTTDEYVFLSHNDVAITSEEFYNSMLHKVEEGCELVGTCYDMHPDRHHSIIVLGCLVKKTIAESVNLYPRDGYGPKPYFETGDRIHLYCKDNNIPFYCFKNSFNDNIVVPYPYEGLPHTVRTVNDDGVVIFLHFARGVRKTEGRYTKPGRLSVEEVVTFCNKHIFKV